MDNYNTICSAATLDLYAVGILLLKEFALPATSLLNKVIEVNIDAIKTVNLVFQNWSLSKDIMLIFDMYLKPHVWYSGGGLIGLNDKDKMCTLYDQNSTYNEMVYLYSHALSFPSQYLVLMKIL